MFEFQIFSSPKKFLVFLQHQNWDTFSQKFWRKYWKHATMVNSDAELVLHRAYIQWDFLVIHDLLTMNRIEAWIETPKKVWNQNISEEVCLNSK